MRLTIFTEWLIAMSHVMSPSILRAGRCLPIVALVVVGPVSSIAVQAQEPAGLAASAIADTSFTWIQRSVPGFRVYFAADSYPATHQDSLLARLPRALSHARDLIDAPPLGAPLDVFFIESRAQMTALIGGRATGFAQPSTRTVILVTNPVWRAFERHEVMHVVAQHAWGPPAQGNDWLVEGLAQAADAICAGYSNAEIMLELMDRHGWIPLDTMLTRFRAQPDLRAYLQAAAFVEHLLERYGAAAVAELWQKGSRTDSPIEGEPLSVIEQRWRAGLPARTKIPATVMAHVESEGCG